VERARATWTDERLDDLSRRVEDGFRRLDEDIRALRAEVSSRFDAQDARIDGRFDTLQRTMIQVGGGIIATMIVGFISLIATQL
jgi:hypothetical protein